MLHILWIILKIALLLLAAVLLLVLTVLLLLLFVPVRYRFRADKGERVLVSGRVHWLLHLLSVHIDYGLQGFRLQVKVFGCPVVGGKPARKKALEEDTEQAAWEEEPEEKAKLAAQEEEPEEKAEQTAQKKEPEEKAELAAQEKELEEETEQAAWEEKSKEKTEQKSLFQRIAGIAGRIRNTFRAFLEKLKNIRDTLCALKERAKQYLRFWQDEHTRLTITHAKKEILYLLRHYLPGRLEGRVLLGFEDPALTGWVLGLLSIVQVFTGNHLAVEADFERPVLEGDLYFQGHVRACHIVKTILATLLNRDCRITYKRIRSFRNG